MKITGGGIDFVTPFEDVSVEVTEAKSFHIEGVSDNGNAALALSKEAAEKLASRLNALLMDLSIQEAGGICEYCNGIGDDCLKEGTCIKENEDD